MAALMLCTGCDVGNAALVASFDDIASGCERHVGIIALIALATAMQGTRS
jgi:hypothetical protein